MSLSKKNSGSEENLPKGTPSHPRTLFLQKIVNKQEEKIKKIQKITKLPKEAIG
jgi:hypothetical protein